MTEARAQVNKAAASGTVDEKASAEAALDKSLINVMAVAEQYPTSRHRRTSCSCRGS